jgi:methylenetetrahydrofolate dehydrogenase (NADP+) / methenyltetrahydrofolate cyclohydrolase
MNLYARLGLDAEWTKKIDAQKRMDCKAVAAEVYKQVDDRFEGIGTLAAPIRVQAFLSGEKPDEGSLRYAKFMQKTFQQRGIDYRLSTAQSADDLDLMILGAANDPKITGIFIYFPTPFNQTENYFLRNVPAHKDIEGLTTANYGRMILDKMTFDAEERYEGVVPCTAKAVLTLLHHYEPIKDLFPPKTTHGPNVVIVNSSPRIGIPLQSLLTRIGATATPCHKQTDREYLKHLLSRADIVVSAFPTGEHTREEDLTRDVREGAIVIDCSHSGNLHPEVAQRASYLSTHDNHLGQITTALSLYNTALCARFQHGMNGKH